MPPPRTAVVGAAAVSAGASAAPVLRAEVTFFPYTAAQQARLLRGEAVGDDDNDDGSSGGGAGTVVLDAPLGRVVEALAARLRVAAAYDVCARGDGTHDAYAHTRRHIEPSRAEAVVVVRHAGGRVGGAAGADARAGGGRRSVPPRKEPVPMAAANGRRDLGIRTRTRDAGGGTLTSELVLTLRRGPALHAEVRRTPLVKTTPLRRTDAVRRRCDAQLAHRADRERAVAKAAAA
jgi:hypothetical protein